MFSPNLNSCVLRLTKKERGMDAILSLSNIRFIHICEAPAPYTSRQAIEIIYSDMEAYTVFSAEDNFAENLLNIMDDMFTTLCRAPN